MERLAALIRQIGDSLVGRISAEEMELLAAPFRPEELAEAVDRMRSARTLTSGLRGEWFMLTPTGREAHRKKTLEMRSLGEYYFGRIVADATFLVVVKTPTGDESCGSGFLTSDYPDSVITAEHVAGHGNRIVRIENQRGEVVCQSVGLRAAEDPDLALIRVKGLPDLPRLRIDWNRDVPGLFDEVFVFGYPAVAGHMPGIEGTRAEVAGILRLSGSNRGEDHKSIILKALNMPGHSGCPVVSEDGMVIGVVVERPSFESEGSLTTRFPAIPIHRISEVDCLPEDPL